MDVTTVEDDPQVLGSLDSSRCWKTDDLVPEKSCLIDKFNAS